MEIENKNLPGACIFYKKRQSSNTHIFSKLSGSLIDGALKSDPLLLKREEPTRYFASSDAVGQYSKPRRFVIHRQ